MRLMLFILFGLLLSVPITASGQEAEELPPGLPKLGLARDCSVILARAVPSRNPQAARLAKAIYPALTGGALPPASLAERMRIRRVPGVSIALIRNGHLSWAESFGVRDTSTCQLVTKGTAFQAGSISKSLTAVLAIQAVKQRRLSLDQNINNYLVRWKLTPGAAAPENAAATLRQILGHTAAISVPDGTGVRPGEPVYDVVTALRGESPAKGPPVQIIGVPGQQWLYSNGGYVVAQLALEDSLKKPFGQLAKQHIFQPLKMNRSSFVQPPSQPDFASGHHVGRPFVDKVYYVPELAAGGLWSTPTDLAKFLIAVRNAVNDHDARLLPHGLAVAMVEPGKGDWGLGFSISGNRFGHDGSRWGMMSKMWIDRKTGDGIVVMSNGEEGLSLADEIIRTAANLYGWDGLQSRSFAVARDASPIFVRGTMNDWGTNAKMAAIGNNHFAADLQVPAGLQSFKLASEDWKTFVLGASDRAAISKNNTLDAEGSDIRMDFPTEGLYRFVIDAPDSGNATLTVTPIASSENAAPN